MANLSALLEGFEELWPLPFAESWDAPGLVSGNLGQEIRKVMLSVDVTSAVVDCAAKSGANLLLAHHPYLMRGVTTVAETTAKGALLVKAIRANLAIYAAHTNADVVTDGVSDVFAKRLGLTGLEPISAQTTAIGIGRIGTLPEAITLGEFAGQVARALPATATGVRVAGDYSQLVERVAVCGGAGDSLLPQVSALKADVFVTADLRHHPVQDVRELAAIYGGAPAIIDVSHWASEFLWLDVAAQQLRRIYPDVEFEVCDLRTDPWDFVVTQ